MIPIYVTDKLKSIDRNLRIRKSHETGRHLVECKCSRKAIPKPILYLHDKNGNVKKVNAPALSDRAIQYRDGYYALFSFGRYGSWVFERIKGMDSTGRKESMADKADREDRLADEVKRKREKDRLNDVVMEIVDRAREK